MSSPHPIGCQWAVPMRQAGVASQAGGHSLHPFDGTGREKALDTCAAAPRGGPIERWCGIVPYVRSPIRSDRPQWAA